MAIVAKLPKTAELPLCDARSLTLLAHVSTPIWLYDLDDHRIRWANAAGVGFWNADSLAELQRRDFRPNSEGTADRLNNLRHLLSNGATITDSWTLFPIGEPRPVRCRFTGVHFPEGKMGTMIEVHEESENTAISGTERRAIEAVRQTPLMISLMSPSGHWLMHNPAATALMNRLDLHNIPNMDNFLSLFGDREAAIALRTRAIEDGSAHALLRMAGRAFRMHAITLRRLNDPVTGKLSLMLVQQDVTRSYRLERQLTKALERERAIVETQRHFLSLTSHEFRTPLSIIDGAARRIAKRVEDKDDPILEKIHSIQMAVRRMSEAVDHTLAASRIEAGKYEFHPVLADLGLILERAIQTQRSLHPHRPILATVPRLPQLMLDPGLVEQILENLLSNAIKYSPDGAPVEITGEARESHIVIRVTDHGIGVPASELPKLFTRFFRSSNAKGIKGTGVGLHAVRFFMDMHDGKVSIASEEGKGSVVTLRFPRPNSLSPEGSGSRPRRARKVHGSAPSRD